MSNLTPTTLFVNAYKVWGTSTLVWGTADIYWGRDALATFTVSEVPDIVATRNISGTEIVLNTLNTGAPEVRYFKAVGVLGNFTFLVDIPPPSNYDYEDTSVDADEDYKYKGAFVASGTINGVAVEVVGQRSSARYVIAESSTL
jgi:hypothetical protein